MNEIELEDEVLDIVDQFDIKYKDGGEEISDFDLASDTTIKPEVEGTEGIE